MGSFFKQFRNNSDSDNSTNWLRVYISFVLPKQKIQGKRIPQTAYFSAGGFGAYGGGNAVAAGIPQ